MGFSLQCVSVRLFSSSVCTFLSICLISPCVSLLIRLFFYCLVFLFLVVFNRLFLHLSVFNVFVYLSIALSTSRKSPLFLSFSVSVRLSACLSAIVCVCRSLFVSVLYILSVPVRHFSYLSVSAIYISGSISNLMSQFNTPVLNFRSVSY
jgi:hypothetical protein